jgi:trehalose 6-phosphate synthase
VYSHGVPWCEPQYFGTLPAAVRTEILSSLLTCDVVVFHATHWRDGFARCCARFLPEAEVTEGSVQHRGRVTRLAVAPFPLDAAAITSLAASEATEEWTAQLMRYAAGRQILARVDRLDLWKNHLRGFAAHAEVLRRKPWLAEEVWFLAVMTLPRYQSIRHRQYEAACRTAVDELTATYGRPDAPAVATLLEIKNTREARLPAVAALSRAATVLINPTYEGFSMVAKEAVLLSETSTVLLSRSAGAYEQLAPVTVPLEPFDITDTADALEQALAGELAPDQARRAGWRRRIGTERAADWLFAVLAEGGSDRADIHPVGSEVDAPGT